ncbi:TNT domain-containing protein [Paenarthrobacter sp. NPDC057355]|uniref:TNT domain-containing protein n=1 Tax=Paenarthrobacter sp. NPDC057355 TaxID=3346105 RepID=UPI00363A423C
MWNRYPPNDGAVSTSRRETRDLSQFRYEFGHVLDRVGFEDGSHLYALNGGEPYSFEARSLPVSDLELPYSRYRLADAWPEGADGWIVETSVVAPHFGRSGGALQVLFFDVSRSLLTVEELIKSGVLTYEQ